MMLRKRYTQEIYMKEINQKRNSVEVLITTVNCNDYIQLLKNMNIQTDAMIGNQTSYDKIDNFNYNSLNISTYAFNERGVGLNRNNLLMRSKADYCLFGDDDLIYVDGYENIVQDYFDKYPDADVIIFNLDEKKKTRFVTKKDFKVNNFNFMRFGAARIAVRRKSILLNGISFNTCFGGGTDHSHGEDTLFLSSCLKQKLKIYAVSKTIAYLPDNRESTWFEGYTDKYFNDKGILYFIMSKRFYKLLCLQDAIRHCKRYGKTTKYILKMMFTGVKDESKI